MIDWNKPVETIGRPLYPSKEVRVLCFDAPGHYPVIGLVEGIVFRWTHSGDGVVRNKDRSLIVSGGHVNIYRSGTPTFHSTRLAADDFSTRFHDRLACVPYEIVCYEGDGL